MRYCSPLIIYIWEICVVQMVTSWFDEFNNEQKNILLLQLLVGWWFLTILHTTQCSSCKCMNTDARNVSGGSGTPHAGSRVERIDPLHFVAGYHTRWLNQALFVLSLSLGFLWLCVVLLARATFYVVLFCIICVFCLLVVLVRLSVPVQVIDWKDSSPKWHVMYWWGC